MANAIPIRVPGTGGSTLEYTLPANMMQFVQSVNAVIDNSGGAATKPILTVLDSTSEVIADVPQGRSIPAGGAGRATWALGLGEEHDDGLTEVLSADPELWTFPPAGPIVSIGRFTIGAAIARDGAAAALTVASGALVITTTNMQHNRVTFQHGATANIGATPSRITIVSDGLYLVTTAAAWTNFGAGDFGLSVGYVPGASPLANPVTISRRIPNQTMTHGSTSVVQLTAGTIITQVLGQNSGAPIAMPIGGLSVIRLGPLP